MLLRSAACRLNARTTLVDVRRACAVCSRILGALKVRAAYCVQCMRRARSTRSFTAGGQRRRMCACLHGVYITATKTLTDDDTNQRTN